MQIRVLACYLLIILLAIFILSCNSIKGRVVTDSGIMYAMIYDYDNIAVSGVLVKVNGKEIVERGYNNKYMDMLEEKIEKGL